MTLLMCGVKRRVVTEPLRYTHSSHQHGLPRRCLDAIRERNDGRIDANKRLHSAARAPKFENFREVEEIARGNYIPPLCFSPFFTAYFRLISP